MTDVMIVVVTLVLLAFILLPMFSGRPGSSRIIKCLSNQKQVVLGFLLWSADNNDQFPWMSFTNGGTAQFVDSTNVSIHYGAISNELLNPKVLACPSDPARIPATDFAKLNNQNISYFIGLSAHRGGPPSILTGDRNLATNGTALTAGVFTLWLSNQPGWTMTIHKSRGNIALPDGSAQTVSKSNLQVLWLASPNTTRRLAIP